MVWTFARDMKHDDPSDREPETGMANVRALAIGIEFWAPLYNSVNKEPKGIMLVII